MQLVDAKKYKNQVKHLYVTAFPKEERAPLFVLYSKTNDERNHFYAIEDNEEFIGLVYTIQDEGMVYVFFLAIAEEKRGCGYGSKVLSLLKEMYPDSVITLMIEDTEDKDADNYTQRIQRLGFYKKNGFKQLHIHINEVGVEYELLGTEEGITQADFLSLMRNYVGGFLHKFIYRKTKFE